MPSVTVPPLPFKTLREIVADSLRQAILDGSIRPGQKIMDVEIAAQMGVSRSPVREALRLLEKEGIVRSTPNRGVSVVQLAHDDVIQLYGIRAVLEGLAAEWACRNIDQTQMEELRRICREMRELLPFASDEERKQFLRKDVEFHELLVSAARSPRLKDMLASIQMQIRLAMAAASVSRLGSAQAASEHELLIDAIARKDAEAAERIARRAALDSGERMARLLYPSDPS